MRSTLLLPLILLACLALPARAQQDGQHREPALDIEFAFVAGGCFEMGDTFGSGQEDEKPVHEVCLGDFYMARNEVTVERFQRFVAETGHTTGPEAEDYCQVRTGQGRMEQGLGVSWSRPGFTQSLFHPVVCVTAADADAYAAWLSEKTGRTFRLPTEAEWEFAARGGGRQMEYATHSGDISRELANYLGEDGPDKWLFTSPTGSFPANPLGIHDMSGNVYEWTTDTYDPKAYASHHGRDPKVEGEGERVKRGGSFGTDKSYLRAANRGSSGFAANDLGFRLVMEP